MKVIDSQGRLKEIVALPSAMRPTVVQTGTRIGDTAACTMPSTPTPGNLLVAFGSHYSNMTTFENGTGWELILNRNGAVTDGDAIAIKVVNADDTTTQTPFPTATSWNLVIFEIANGEYSPADYRSLKESVGTSATLKIACEQDNSLLIGMVATVSENGTPTITGATASSTTTGTAASLSPRAVTPYSATASMNENKTIVATYGASETIYIQAMIITPRRVTLTTVEAATQAEVDAGSLTTKYVAPGTVPQQPGLCGGRLTLTTGVPVTTTDVTGAGTLYFTPFIHNRVALYNGSKWVTYTFTERSLALSVTSGFNYDIFLYDNAGTLTLEAVVWTNDTTRATALATQDGVYVKTGATSRLFVGTIRASGTNTCEDSYGGASQAGGKRYVWNNYNRVKRTIGVIDTTNTWTYGTATWRQVNATAGNKVEYVVGLSIDLVKAVAAGIAGSGLFDGNGVGIDSTSANSAQSRSAGATSASESAPTTGYYAGYPGIGYHALNWLEISRGGATTTFYGDNGGTAIQTGMQAEILA